MRGKKRTVKSGQAEKSVVERGASLIEYLPYLDRIRGALRAGWDKVLLIGGTRSGKSYQLTLEILRIALNPESELTEKQLEKMRKKGHKAPMILVARQKFVDMHTTILKDVFGILANMGLWPEDDRENDFVKYDRSKHMILFKQTGAEIWFAGADRAGGKMGAGFDVVWLNEISEIQQEFYEQCSIRYELFMLFDCNPKMGESHWARQKLLKSEGETVFVHRSTFRDNYFLSKDYVARLLSCEPTQENVRRGTADEYLWKVYGLGIFAVKEGLVFSEGKDWEVIENASVPSGLSWCWALDVGFNHSMSFGRISLGEGCLYVDERLYTKGLSVSTPAEAPEKDSLIRRLPGLGVKKGDVIIYDAARPDVGSDLNACGYNAIACRKEGSSRSVVPQLVQMKTRFIRVTRRSMGWQSEVQEYAWNARDPDGNPVAGNGDDSIDMSRYGATYLIRAGNKGRGVSGIGGVKVRRGGEEAVF